MIGIILRRCVAAAEVVLQKQDCHLDVSYHFEDHKTVGGSLEILMKQINL